MTDSAVETLRRSPVFRLVPDAHLDEVRALGRDQRYDFGETIVRQGDEVDAFYLLVLGRARVVKETERGREIALATLRPGDVFGETALLAGGTRTATVRCSTTVQALRFDRHDVLQLMERHPGLRLALESTAHLRTLHNFLYEFSNFGRLPARVLRSMVERLAVVDAKAGDLIIREGDPPGPMFVVESGKVRLFVNGDGRERNLAFCRSGDFFGELSILNGSPRAASAEALGAVRLLALQPDVVRQLRSEFPEFRQLLDERLAQYRPDAEARVPLDVATEQLPAEVAVHDKVALDGAPEDDDQPFAEAGGLFRRRGRIRRFAHVQQIDEMDCGAACLGMICRYFGRDVSLARIRQLCHTSRDGTSLKGICHAATELGLAARALKVSHRNLARMPLPAIVHWDGNHWMVLVDVGRSSVRVDDPAVGLRRIPRSEFEAKWSGYAALFDYTEAFQRAPEARSTLSWLAPFVRQHRTTLVQAFLLAIIGTVLQLVFPIFTQMVVDTVIVEHDATLLLTILISMAATVVFVQLANLAQEYLLSFAAVRIDAAILDLLTRQLLALPLLYFSSRRTGDIQRRLDGARQIRQFAVQHGIGGVLALLTLVGALALMLVYSPALTALFLATVPIYLALMWFSVRVLRPLFADIEESQGKYASHQVDAIKGIEAVKAASGELAFRDAMLNEFLGVSQKLFRANFIVMSYDGVIQTVGLIATALFLWFGATRVIDGQLTVGAFVAFGSLTTMASTAILRALGIWDQFQLVSVLLNRLNDVFEPEPEQGRDRSRLTPVPSLEGHVELRQVGFQYGGPEAPHILEGIDLVFPHGKTTAIVGRSGSGKTTLVKLVAGLLEPTAGTILLDHVDLKTLNYRDVRRHIGMVLQENHMFDATITHNIAFGDPEPDVDRVLRSAQAANAHDFIMRLPMGYETRIGEAGLGLSGGQRQRIAIARALYLDPAILIFDEATSALDTESERAIQDNLGRMTAGRTAIVIAHRLSTIRDADAIVVLEQGEVVEVGTHDELMARRGLYFHLSSQQLGL